jgi:hypothetical protein
VAEVQQAKLLATGTDLAQAMQGQEGQLDEKRRASGLKKEKPGLLRAFPQNLTTHYQTAPDLTKPYRTMPYHTLHIDYHTAASPGHPFAASAGPTTEVNKPVRMTERARLRFECNDSRTILIAIVCHYFIVT